MKLKTVRKKTENSSEDSADEKHGKIKRNVSIMMKLLENLRRLNPQYLTVKWKLGEEVEAWLSRMQKYFQIYNYSGELKERMAIYNLIGKEDIWWQDIKRIKNIKERKITWKTFKRYFKKQYLSEQYYEGKEK
jgi:hypothetical protein